MSKNEHSKTKSHASHATQKKVFDVTRPGRTPAAPNSRAVVPSAKPPVADDQFVPSAPILRASDPSAQHELLSAKNRKGLQPLSAPETPDAADADADGGVSASAEAAASSQTADAAVTAPVTGSDPLVSMPDTTTEPVTSASAETSQADTGEPSAPAFMSDDMSAQTTTTSAVAAKPTTAQPAASSSSAVTSDITPAAPAEDTPAHFAMEHTVETAQNVPIWEHPDTSEQVEGTRAPAAQRSTKTIEDLLAETGAPTLEPEKKPSLIVSHHNPHHARWWEPVLIFLAIIIVAAIAINFLLDADIIKTSLQVPHTDLLK